MRVPLGVPGMDAGAGRMAEKIGIIRGKLQAADISELPVLLSVYETDERAGVQAEIARAKKRIAAYEKG